MSIELYPAESGARLWTTAPVWITLSHFGHGNVLAAEHKDDPGAAHERDLVWSHLVRLNRAMYTPNGKLNFLGLVKGLPVVRCLLPNADRAVFVTGGGSAVTLTAHANNLSTDLAAEAQRLGLTSATSTIHAQAALNEPSTGERSQWLEAAVEQPQVREHAHLSVYLSRVLGVPVIVWTDTQGRYQISGHLTAEQKSLALTVLSELDED